MEAPSTPQRERDPIEDIKQSLSTKWALGLPTRPLVSSPSARNKDAVDEKIYNYIHYLYYHKSKQEPAALDVAMTQFNQEAPIIRSHWQFKSRAEIGVTPNPQHSSPRLDFLHRQNGLGEDASRELVQLLERILGSVAEKVKNKQPYHSPTSAKRRSLADLDNDYPTTPFSTSRRRPSRHGLAGSMSTTATTQQNLSDELRGDHVNAILQNQTLPSENLEAEGTRQPALPTDVSEDLANRPGQFANSPSSPSQTGAIRLSLVASNEGLTKEIVFAKSTFAAPYGRKRDRAVSPSPTARKLSRGNSNDSAKPTATITSVKELDDMGTLADVSRSFDNLPSVSSSMTSASSAWTSPNTSFTSNTQNTSPEPPKDRKAIAERSRPSVPKPSSYDTTRHFPLNLQVGYLGDTTAADSGDINTNPFLTRQQPTLSPDFAFMLNCNSPFMSDSLVEHAKVPFRQIYEVCRIARSTEIDISAFSHYLKTHEDDYLSLCSALDTIILDHGRTPPERSPLTAWNKAVMDFPGVSLNAELTFLGTSRLSSFSLAVQVSPLKVEASSNRLFRHFGRDRFLVLAIPGLSIENLPACLKPHTVPFHDVFVNWLVTEPHKAFGRTWRAFYLKPESLNKKQKAAFSTNDPKYRIYLFAEDGHGFTQGQVSMMSGPPGGVVMGVSPILNRPRVSVLQMIEWFMPFRQNQNMQCLKFFSRLQLGLTSTHRTVTFKPSQIVRSDDAYADSPVRRRLNLDRSEAKKTGRKGDPNNSIVMNDGCARISRLAASRIAGQLRLEHIPSVFQGRIGGSKGVWMVDAIDEVLDLSDADGRSWIEITDSQSKFEAPPIDSFQPDSDRVTFEVNAWSKDLIPSYLNFQLIPILQDRGVPDEVIKQKLIDDLHSKTNDLQDAMQDGLALRKWCHSNFPTTSDRVRNDGIKMLGGLPDSKIEKVIWFLDHGFQAKTCRVMKDSIYQLHKDYCQRLEDRMNIGLEFSTNALMIADPLDILHEDEVHISFSRPFKDSQGFDQYMLHDVDVLVARLPAHLPSDIQKVRAVCKPELERYRDVIVFSSRGKTSLASKLSGGDYDGDKAWICWDHSLVERFQNATVPEQRPPDFYGITQDETKVSDIFQQEDFINKFLVHAFDFNLQKSLLGKVTLYHEALCYHRGCINSDAAISLALLAGHLVDGPKNGYKFSDSDWTVFLKKMGLPQRLATPAYKERSKAKPTSNLTDDLVFNVARKVREEVLGAFNRNFKDVPTWDHDLVKLAKQETETAKSDESLAKALTSLRSAIDKVVCYWRSNCHPTDEDWDGFSGSLKREEKSGPSFNVVVEECRKRFLAIPPCDDKEPLASASVRIQQWKREHQAGTSSYWDLLKASVAFKSYYQGKCIWYMAGLELGEMKATANGRGTYRTVVNPLYEVLKPDGRLLDAARARQAGDDETQMVAGDDEDDEDEFGDWGSQFAFDGD